MKAVILAAGRGTRLHPITLTRPKHLVPICGKPLIDHMLKTIKRSGIDEVVLKIILEMAKNGG
jgi:mannose-1-phosphate guanylyltransferase